MRGKREFSMPLSLLLLLVALLAHASLGAPALVWRVEYEERPEPSPAPASPPLSLRPYARYTALISVEDAGSGHELPEAAAQLEALGALPSLALSSDAAEAEGELEWRADEQRWAIDFAAGGPSVGCLYVTTALSGGTVNGNVQVGAAAAVVTDTSLCSSVLALPPPVADDLEGLGAAVDHAAGAPADTPRLRGSADAAGVFFAVLNSTSGEAMYAASSFGEQATVRLSDGAVWGGGAADGAPVCADWAADERARDVLSTQRRVLVVSAAGLVEGERFTQPAFPDGTNVYAPWTASGELLREAWAVPLQWRVAVQQCVRLVALPTQQAAAAPDDLVDVVLAAADGPEVLVSLAAGEDFVALPSGLPAGSEVVSLEIPAELPSDVLVVVRNATDGLTEVWRFRTGFGSLAAAATASAGGLEALLEARGGEWSLQSRLPAAVSELVEPAHGGLAPLPADGSAVAGAAAALEVTAAAMARGGGPDMFAWGSAVLYSPDAGRSFTLVQTLADPDDRVLSLETAPGDGWFAFTTALGDVWVGHAGRTLTARLGAYEPSPALPYVGARGAPELRLVAFDGGSAPATVSRDLRRDAHAAAGRVALAEGLACPYTAVEFDGGALPRAVFLDRGESYEARVRVSVAPWAVGAGGDLLSLQASGATGAVGVTLRRVDASVSAFGGDADDLLSGAAQEYVLEARDLDDVYQPQRAPGFDLARARVRLAAVNGSLACGSFHAAAGGAARSELGGPAADANDTFALRAGEPAAAPSRPAAAGLEASQPPAPGGPASWDLTVLSGCPPGRALVADREASRGRFEQCEEHPDPLSGEPVSCTSFVYEYEPRMRFVHANGTEEPYTGRYTFRVVGGGPTLGSMAPYTEAQQRSFNQGSKAVWTVLESLASTPSAAEESAALDASEADGGHAFFRAAAGGGGGGDSVSVLEYSTAVQWVCGIGSPCSGVIPNWPNTPDYYFRVRVSTRGAELGSHCDLSAEYTVRLHGLTMDYIAIITATSLCIAALGAFILSGFVLKRDRYAEYKVLITEKADALEEERDTKERVVEERRRSRARMTLMSLNQKQ